MLYYDENGGYTMSLWLVRAGQHGAQEETALNQNVVTIGWNEFSDLSNLKTRDELAKIYWKEYPDVSNNKAGNQIGQIWRFVHDIQVGDLVALPLKTESSIAIGRVEGNYEYRKLTEEVRHIRRVKWIKTIPRSEFDQDVLYSFGAIMTVCRIERNDAEKRVVQLLEGRKIEITDTEVSIGEEDINIEQSAQDQITKYVGIKFKGHDLARLVDEILKAQGYVTKRSLPGPDGGVDILASAGALGFDEPRICVQVKSSTSPVDVRILRELQGVMSKVKAGSGLLVSWGGFTSSAKKEASDAFFSIRLWDQGDLLKEIFKDYERFGDELKAELPLKRMWGLVVEE